MRKVFAAIVLIWQAVAAQAEPVTIAALGDSLTQGYGLMQDEGFVPQLQSWLDDKGADAVLINAGVSGDTTAGGAARVAWTLTPEVDAMIVALGGNDLLRGIDSGVARGNLETILTEADKARVPVLVIGMVAPGNYGADYKQAFEANYAELAEEHGALYMADFFQGIREAEPDQGAAIRDLFQGDGIHPNAKGVALEVEAIGPKVLELIGRVQAE